MLEEVAEAVTPPVLSAVYPTEDATEIPVNAELSITFSKNIDAATVNGSTLPIVDASGTAVGGKYSVSDATVTFAATGGFGYGKSYTVTITSGVLDTDGNPLAEAFSWTFITSLTPDVVAPSLASLSFEAAAAYVDELDRTWLGSLCVELTVAASDDRAVAQVMLSDSPSFLNASWVTFNAAAPVYELVLGGMDGPKRLYSKVKDGAGNVSDVRVSEEVHLDLEPPTIDNLLINGGASATNSGLVSLKVFAGDDEGASSGLHRFRYRPANGSWSDWLDLSLDSGAGAGEVSNVATNAELGGSAVFEAQVIDRVGHVSAVASRTIRYEQTPPTVIGVSWDDQALFPYNGSVLRIQFDEEMRPDSFPEGSFTLARTAGGAIDGTVNLTASGATPNATAELWGLELYPNTSYLVTLSGAVQDIAGNPLGADKTWYFSTGDAEDTSPPTGAVTLTDQGGAVIVVTLPSGSIATDDATLELDFSAITDDYNIPYGIKIWGDNGNAAAFFEEDASWRTWSDTVSWTLSAGSGTKYVLYKLMDSANNQSVTPRQLRIILDSGELPTIATVSVNGGQSHTNASDRAVDLTIEASDAYSGVKQMIISHDPSFAGASWMNYTPILEGWVLPDGDGTRIFYAKVRDYLDQESATNQACSITLDRAAPSVSFNVESILASEPTLLAEGSEGSDLYRIIEEFGVASCAWEQLSGQGTLYFNADDGGSTDNDGIGLREPYIHATVEGSYFARVTVTDNAGNSSQATIPFSWDVTPPADLAAVNVSAYDTSGQPTWSWATVADADYYRASYSSDFSSYVDVHSTSFTPNAPLAPDGVKTLYVRAQDEAGNYSTTRSASTHVDTTAPTISVTTNSFVANVAAPTATLAFNGTHGSVADSGSGVQSGLDTSSYLWEELSTPKYLSFGSASALSTTVSASIDKTYQIRFRARDLAGNVSYATVSLLRDTNPPAATAVTGPAITPSLRPTWSWSSSSGGAGLFQFYLTNDSDSTTVYTSGETTVKNYKPASSLPDFKTYTMRVRERDGAGNWSAYGTRTTVVDSSATTPAQIALGDGYPALRTVASVEWDLLTGCGGAANLYRYDVDSTGTWTYGGAALSENVPVTISRSGLTEGAHTIVVQERIDTAWRTDIQASHTITVDTVKPTEPTLTGTGLATGQSYRTATPDTTPTWIWSPGGGGGNGVYSYRVTRVYTAAGIADGAVIVAQTAETAAMSYTPSSALAEGTYALSVRERDEAGNWSLDATQYTTVDRTKPTMVGVLVRGPTHPDDTDYTYTNSTMVSVDITADIDSEDNAAYPRPVTINYLDYNPESSWETYGTAFPTGSGSVTAAIATELPSANGTRYVYAKLIDEAGNATGYMYDTIILDTVAPTVSFSINAGATTTPSLSFFLTLTASDNLSTDSQLEVRDRNIYGSGWMPYRAYATSMLSDFQWPASAGNKTTYVGVRDAAGNEAQASDSITLEVPVPTYATKGTYSGGYSYVYYEPVTDPAGGSYTTRYYVYSTTDPDASPNSGDPVTYRYNTTSASSSYAPIPNGELHYFFVRAYDSDTGGYGPYSAASVLGFSSNVTVVYDDDEPADVTRAEALKAILEDDQGITGLANIYGAMPTWSVTLLPEDLISATYSTEARIYGDPIIVTHGSSFTTASTNDGRVRNIAASSKGTIAMGTGGAYFIYRVDQNWSAWALTGTQPSDIDSGNQMGLNAIRSSKTVASSASEDIWYTPLYYGVLYNSYRESSVAVNIFSADTERRGIYISSGANPTGGYIYAGDAYSGTYFPVVRQGEYCYYGYYEIPDAPATGQVFLINLVSRMASF